MKNLSKIFTLLILSTLLFSCDVPPERYTINRTSSTFELRQLIQNERTTTSSSAMYFLVIGSYASNTTTTEEVKVFAKVNGDYRMLTMPLEDVRIRINNKLTKPTLLITYRDALHTDEEICDSKWVSKKYIISCPEKYIPEKLLPINL